MFTLNRDEKLVKSDTIKKTIANSKKELLLKFLVLGDFGVGKTSIIRRYCEGSFKQVYKITIGADFCMKTLTWEDNTKINIQLWDIAGHERFGHLTRVYYKYAVAAIIVFDLTRLDTLESVTKWLTDLREKVVLPNGQPIPVVLFANKGDVDYFTKIPEKDIKMLCQKFSIHSWHVTSARDNININEALHELITVSLQNKQQEKNNNGTITLNTGQSVQNLSSSGGCCN